MQRIEWVAARLDDWAVWRITGQTRTGGYASPAYNVERVSQTDDVRAGMRRFDPGEDCAALEVDQAIASLPEELYRTVLMFYTYDGGTDLVALRLRITRATLHRRLCQADIRIAEWFDLNKNRKNNLKIILPLIHNHA